MLTLSGLLSRTRVQLWLCLGAAIALFTGLSVVGPAQLPVVLYKLTLEFLGGFGAVCLWLALVPIGNAARYLQTDWSKAPDADIPGEADFKVASGYFTVFCVCLCCTAMAFCTGMLAVAWGL